MEDNINKKLNLKSDFKQMVYSLKVINKIIKENLSNYQVSIMDEDLESFLQFLQMIETQERKWKFNTYIISNKNYKITLTEEEKNIINRETFCKYIILLISYSLNLDSNAKKPLPKQNLEYINFISERLVKYLYLAGILLESDVTLIFKFIMVMSLFSNINSSSLFKKNKQIKNVQLLWQVFSAILNFFVCENKELEESLQKSRSEELNSLITNIFEFLNEYFLVNVFNIKFISESTKLLNLIELLKISIFSDKTKTLILNTIVNVYQNNYNTHILGKLINYYVKGFVNTSNNFYKVNQREISFRSSRLVFPERENSNLNNNITQSYLNTILDDVENISCVTEFVNTSIKEKRDTNLLIKNGFIFSEFLKTGLKIAPITFPNKDGFTLIFSFKLVPETKNLNNKKRNLISFVLDKDNLPSKREKPKDFYQLRIYIKNQKLFISNRNKDTFEIQELNENETYLVSIVMQAPGILSSRSKIEININGRKLDAIYMNGYPKGGIMVCYVGYQKFFEKVQIKNQIGTTENLTNMFSGVIGTIILFNDILNQELIKNIMSLGGDYENILLRHYEVKPNLNISSRIEFDKILAMLISPRVN